MTDQLPDFPQASRVLARFYVASTTRTAYDPGALQVTLQAVSRGPENKEWSTATPSGSLTMTIKSSPAAEFFSDRLGKDIAITFEDAPSV